MTTTTDDAGLVLDLSRRFDAPPERVFDAWVSPDWAAWIGPADAQCETVQQEAQPGGRFLIRMTLPDGSAVDITGVYREVLRPRRLVLTFCGGHAGFDTLISVDFQPDGIGTLMTLRQTGLADEARHAGFERGWTGPGGAFDKLAALLARG